MSYKVCEDICNSVDFVLDSKKTVFMLNGIFIGKPISFNLENKIIDRTKTITEEETVITIKFIKTINLIKCI